MFRKKYEQSVGCYLQLNSRRNIWLITKKGPCKENDPKAKH